MTDITINLTEEEVGVALVDTSIEVEGAEVVVGEAGVTHVIAIESTGEEVQEMETWMSARIISTVMLVAALAAGDAVAIPLRRLVEDGVNQ